MTHAFTPGDVVRYTDKARMEWRKAGVLSRLPEGEGVVIPTPKPYLPVPGLVYVQWTPEQISLTDYRALEVVEGEEKRYTLDEIYTAMVMNVYSTMDHKTAVKLTRSMHQDVMRLIAWGWGEKDRHTHEEWDNLARDLHLYLGGEEVA